MAEPTPVPATAPVSEGKQTPRKTPVSTPVRIFRILLRIILVPVVLVVLGLGSLGIVWLANQAPADQYLVAGSRVHVLVDSVSELYANTVDNPVSDTVLSAFGMKDLMLTLWEWQGRLSAWQSVILNILDLQAHAMLFKDNSMLIVANTAERGVFLQLLPTLGRWFGVPGMSVSVEAVEGREFLALAWKPGEQPFLYVAYEKANILASTSLATLIRAFAASTDPALRVDMTRLKTTLAALTPHQTIRLAFDSAELLSGLGKENQLLGLLNTQYVSPESGVLGIKLGSQSIALEMHAKLSDPQNRVGSLFSQEVPLDFVRFLPRSTSLYSGLRVDSFKELYTAWAEGFPQFAPVLEDYETILQILLGLGVNDVLYAWPGGEVAVTVLASSDKPVFSLQVGDQAAWARLEKAMLDTGMLDASTFVTRDSLQLRRLEIPDFWQAVLGLFGVNLALPYFVQHDGWLMFCEEPDPLAELMGTQNRLLQAGSDPDVQADGTISAEVLQELRTGTDVIVYFDLARQKPGFIRQQPALSTIADLYRRGTARFGFNGDTLSAVLRLEGSVAQKAAMLPGYPVQLEPRPSDDRTIPKPILFTLDASRSLRPELHAAPIQSAGSGGTVPQILWIGADRRVHQASLSGRATASSPELPLVGRLLPPLQDGSTGILAGGLFYPLDAALQPLFQEPLQTGLSFTFAPLDRGTGWLAYHDDMDAIVELGPDGTLETILKDLDPPVMVHPLVAKDGWLVATNNLEGRIYQFDRSGNEQANQVRMAGGIVGSRPLAWTEAQGSVSARAFVPGSDQIEGTDLAITRQDGTIVFFPRGSTDRELWIEAPLPSPTRTDATLLTRGRGRVAALSEDGTIAVYSSLGTLVRARRISGVEGSFASIGSFEALGASWIVVQSGNLVWLLDSGLGLVYGFPIPGREWLVYNVDARGAPELFVLGLDGLLAAYRLPLEQK